MKNKSFYIFWDMDGTLFEFIEGGDIYAEGYFENLEPNKNIVQAAKKIEGMVLNNGITLKGCVISNYLADSPHDCIQEKNKALNRETHFSSEQRIFLPCGRSKWDAVSRLGIASNAILIDDYGKNTDSWQGPYVKVSKDAEDMKKESKRHNLCISPDSSAEEIVSTISKAVASYIYT